MCTLGEALKDTPRNNAAQYLYKEISFWIFIHY